MSITRALRQFVPRQFWGRLYGFGVASGGIYLRDPKTWPRVWIPNRGEWDRFWARSRITWNRVWRWQAMAQRIASRTLVKTESEDRDFGFDFTDSPEIQADDVITAATVTGGAGLTIGTPRFDETLDGEFLAGQGVVVRISGGTAASYLLSCRATLDTGRVLVIPARLVVVEDTE